MELPGTTQKVYLLQQLSLETIKTLSDKNIQFCIQVSTHLCLFSLLYQYLSSLPHQHLQLFLFSYIPKANHVRGSRLCYLTNYSISDIVEVIDRSRREIFLNNEKSVVMSHANGFFSSQLKLFKFGLQIILCFFFHLLCTVSHLSCTVSHLLCTVSHLFCTVASIEFIFCSY